MMRMITKKMYDEAQLWFRESTRCISRAVILKTHSPTDFNGIIEALQHCFELACKSWYFLIGSNYPKNHDAAKYIDKVSKHIHSQYPIFDYKKMERFLEWMKENSSYLAKLHQMVIYGDEDRNVLASDLFTSEDVRSLTIKVSGFWAFTQIQLVFIGRHLGYMTEKKYIEFLKFYQYVKNFEDEAPLSEEEIKKLFSFYHS